ncbi:hypothetical protein [Rhizobium leguminosarum]|uniref:hypothetical protein n=1 Tax=Rhizobium leguminosarum TaxID=384 RepID=UPI001AE7C8B7|nr:hypothetical protein [Rhizobium leguminosarum]MBP2442696.1 hypothetical protein [Rhizobium leguminosarum]
MLDVPAGRNRQHCDLESNDNRGLSSWMDAPRYDGKEAVGDKGKASAVPVLETDVYNPSQPEE